MSITAQPKRPTVDSWNYLGKRPDGSHAWHHRLADILVTSGVEATTTRGPEWHLAISGAEPMGPRRMPTASEISIALSAFGATDFERDDHGTKITANYWQPVNPDLRGECECKRGNA